MSVDGMHGQQKKAVSFSLNVMSGLSHGFKNRILKRSQYKEALNNCKQQLMAVIKEEKQQDQQKRKPVTLTSDNWQGELQRLQENLEKIGEKKEPETVEHSTEVHIDSEKIDRMIKTYRRRFPVALKTMFKVVQCPVMPFSTYYNLTTKLAMKRVGIVHRNIDDYRMLMNQPILLVDMEKFQSKFGRKDLIGAVSRCIVKINEMTGNSFRLVSETYNLNPKNSKVFCFWLTTSTQKFEILKEYRKWGFLFE